MAGKTTENQNNSIWYSHCSNVGESEAPTAASIHTIAYGTSNSTDGLDYAAIVDECYSNMFKMELFGRKRK